MTEPPPGHHALDRQQLQQRAVRGALWTGIHTAVSLPLAFGVNILLARVLGVEGYGRLAYLTTLITIASVIAGMGVTTALIQFGSKEHAVGKPEAVRRLLSGSQGFRLLVSGPLVALVVIALVRVELWLLVVALVFGIGAPALLGGARAALTIENRTDRAAQLTMVGNAVQQVAVVVAVLIIGTADSVWSARVIVSGLLLALPLISIARPYRRAVLRPRGPWTLPRPFWSFAIPTGIAGILGTVASNRIEVVLLDWFADPIAMGLFGLAFGLAGHVYAPAQAFVGPLIPAVSGLAEVDESSVRRAFLRTSRAASAIGGALVATALPTLAVLVPVIYGRQFAPASDIVVVLGMAGAVTLISSPHSAFLMARLGGRRLLWVSIVTLVVTIGLGLALIPVFGVWGAAASCSAGMIVRAAMVTVGEARALAVPLHELVSNVGGLVVGTLVAALVWATARSVSAPELVVASVAALVGAALYVLLVRFARSGLTMGDVHAITQVLPHGLQRIARTCLQPVAHFPGERTP